MEKTIKMLFIAAVVVGSVACRNESQIVDENPSCEDLITFAQADLDVADARFSGLTRERSILTTERNRLLEAGRSGLSTVVSETMLSDLDNQILGMDQSINAQSEVIVDARRDLAAAIAACPSADQSALQVLDVDGADLENEIDKVEVAEESAREMIDRLNPMIVEAYEEIQGLEAERADAEDRKASLLVSSLPIDAIAELVVEIDADIESIDEDLLSARRRHTQLSDARRMAYLTVDTTVSAVEGLETAQQN